MPQLNGECISACREKDRLGIRHGLCADCVGELKEAHRAVSYVNHDLIAQIAHLTEERDKYRRWYEALMNTRMTQPEADYEKLDAKLAALTEVHERLRMALKTIHVCPSCELDDDETARRQGYNEAIRHVESALPSPREGTPQQEDPRRDVLAPNDLIAAVREWQEASAALDQWVTMHAKPREFERLRAACKSLADRVLACQVPDQLLVTLRQREVLGLLVSWAITERTAAMSNAPCAGDAAYIEELRQLLTVVGR